MASTAARVSSVGTSTLVRKLQLARPFRCSADLRMQCRLLLLSQGPHVQERVEPVHRPLLVVRALSRNHRHVQDAHVRVG